MNHQPNIKTGKGAGKHLYDRACICWIPLIGGIVGIWLTLLGIFKYKDWKLILAGSIAILWTALIYGFILNMFEFGFVVEGFAKSTPEFLNGVIEDIETFKNETGRYPDSLEQLNNNGRVSTIYDPLVSRGKGPMTTYNYEKVENGYYLFSSGVDRIPNTTDDIHPDLSSLKTDKIGLLIRKNFR